MSSKQPENNSLPHRRDMRQTLIHGCRLLLLLAASFCVMAFTHEVGHLVGGHLAGATLQSASLWPWQLPYSIFSPDPRPLVTLWAGPVLGVIVPVVAAWAIRRRTAWFIANFCLLANGTYLALGWVSGDSHLDTARLLANGASPFTISTFCLISIMSGYWRLRASIIEMLFYSQVGQKDDL